MSDVSGSSAAPAAPAASTPSSTPSTPSSTPSAPSAAPSQASSNAASSAPKATAGQSKDSADAAPPSGGPPGETAAEKRERLKFTHKVDGKDVEREYTMEELSLQLQKSIGAEKRFEEAARVRKQFDEYRNLVKKDPAAALKLLDPELDFRSLSESYLKPLYEKELMPEQERQRFEEQQELERYRNAEKENKEMAARQAQEESDRIAWEKMEKDWVGALEKSGLAPDRRFVYQMLQIGQEFLNNGVDLSPDHIVAELKDRMAYQTKHAFGGLKGEQLIKALGDDIVNEIMSFKVSQVQKAKPVQEPIKPPTPGKFEPDGEKPRFTKSFTSMKEFSKYLNDK